MLYITMLPVIKTNLMNNLETFLVEIKKERKSKKVATRHIIELYGVTRRGWRVIERVNSWLAKNELIMEPSFESANIYGSVKISPKPTITVKTELKKPKYSDAIPRLGIIKSSDLNNSELSGLELITVSKENTLDEAISLMILHNYSQLPILISKREVYGIISWKTIGKALSLGKECSRVADCYEPVEVLNFDEPLFKAVKIILEKEVVLVRNFNKEISGIVTSTDIGEQFLILSEPFLLIEQIENFIRILLNEKLTYDDINKVLDLEKYDKEINHISDLTFGHYVRIFENEDLFKKIEINVNRVMLQKMLVEVNKIRNEVMHFSPEAMEEKDLISLRRTQNFLQQIIENK